MLTNHERSAITAYERNRIALRMISDERLLDYTICGKQLSKVTVDSASTLLDQLIYQPEIEFQQCDSISFYYYDLLYKDILVEVCKYCFRVCIVPVGRKYGFQFAPRKLYSVEEVGKVSTILNNIYSPKLMRLLK
jgi:hypothetical protein